MLRRGFAAGPGGACVFAIALLSASGVMQIALAQERELPAFLDAKRHGELEAARAALEATLLKSAATVPTATRTAGRDEATRLLIAASNAEQRAEAERALAADVRARAEALSERFSADIADAQKPASAPPAVSKNVGLEPRAAASMQRAAAALARARHDLEEATRRAEAAGKNRNSASWQQAKAQIDEARQRAAEAVEQAQKVIEEQKLAVPAVAQSEPPATEKPRDPRMVPPYALGAWAR